MRAYVAPLAALLIVITMSACSSPVPIALGSAPASPSNKINLSLPMDPSGFYDFNSWPRACDLLSDGDLRAVFPQATDIARVPEDLKLTLLPDFSPFSNGNGGGGTHTVRGAQCTFTFSLPGIERRAGDRWTGYSLRLEIDATGSREVVRENRPKANIPGQRNEYLGGADCVVSPSLGSTELSCSSTNLAFSIKDLTGNFSQDDGTIRFQRGDQITTFTGDQLAQRSDFMTRHILPELVKTITGKL
ncbi:MAG TPA: hypothetical protein VK735_16200 [Pseudonocardia sp.]|uniref:hypothetical protein n=1 Tax=Pseudonocardia sp. TaxID=60912 RepID=UPI002BC997D3|nr:hypothetical protein [Pseudonocardia sp.]HTF48989.1 hypothetical protein [Pseudonocardia sp.]